MEIESIQKEKGHQEKNDSVAVKRNKNGAVVLCNPSRCNTKRLHKFMNYSSLSTFTYVFYQSRSCTKRIFWLSMLLASLSAFLYFTARNFEILASRPTATTISLERESELDFPAVTLCSFSNLNTTRLLNFDEKLVDNFTTIFNAARLQTVSGLERCEAVGRQLANETGVDIGWGELLLRASNLASSIITSCTFSGTPCSAADFEPISTTAGICYTFNGKQPRRSVDGTGVRRGLQLKLLNDKNQTFTSFDSTGYRVIIHNPDEPPRPFANGIAIALGSTVFVGMKEVRTIDQTTYGAISCHEGNGAYQGNLIFPNDPAFPYSRSICETDCLYTDIAEKCDCVERQFYSTTEKFNATKNCTLADICCEFQEFYFVNNHCDCLLSCNFVDRTFTVSNAGQDEGAAAINIYYESLVVEARTTVDAYTPTNLIVSIGGNSGLFLGFTMLTVAELLMWLTGEIRDRFFFFIPKVFLTKRKIKDPGTDL